MGIKGLIPFLNEKVPGSMTEVSLESLSGEYVAVDASTALYQFSIAIRDSSYFNSLVNASGESTSHIYGLMSRCSKLLECGIKPVFVFDSKPPDLKLKTLDKRRQKRDEASSSLKQAIAEGDKESIRKLMGRTVKVTKEMNDSAKKLLRLMGVPVIEALEEAEAQCAYLVRKSLCRFVASEDTDTLVFGGAFLLRNVTASSNKKIIKVDLHKVLDGLGLSFEQFVDFCILCGCDYCDTLEGVGPKTAYSLVQKHSSLEEIVSLRGANYDDFREAKEYFMSPKVNEFDQSSLKMGSLDVEALTHFLVSENSFAKERVDKFVEKLLKSKNRKVQRSMLSFLTYVPAPSKPREPVKRKGSKSGAARVFKGNSVSGSSTGGKRPKLSNYPAGGDEGVKETSDVLSSDLFDRAEDDEELKVLGDLGGSPLKSDLETRVGFAQLEESVSGSPVCHSREVQDQQSECRNESNPQGEGGVDVSPSESVSVSVKGQEETLFEQGGKMANGGAVGFNKVDVKQDEVLACEHLECEKGVKSDFVFPDDKTQLKVNFSNRRILDDDDDMTTTTSDMNSEVEVKRDEKKGRFGEIIRIKLIRVAQSV